MNNIGVMRAIRPHQRKLTLRLLPDRVSQGCHAGLGGQLRVAGEAVADITQLGEDLRGADLAGPRQRHDELTVGQFGDGVLDARGELVDLLDERW